MSITLNKHVNLEASFEKLKEKLEIAKNISDPFRASNMLQWAIETHMNECTTSQDIPDDLFTTLGNYFKPE